MQEYLLRNENSAKIALAFRTSTERWPDVVTKIDPVKPALPGKLHTYLYLSLTYLSGLQFLNYITLIFWLSYKGLG